MQTADLQTRTWVSQTSTPVSQNSTSVRLFRLAISDGNGNTIYNLPFCIVAHRFVLSLYILAFSWPLILRGGTPWRSAWVSLGTTEVNLEGAWREEGNKMAALCLLKNVERVCVNPRMSTSYLQCLVLQNLLRNVSFLFLTGVWCAMQVKSYPHNCVYVDLPTTTSRLHLTRSQISLQHGQANQFPNSFRQFIQLVFCLISACWLSGYYLTRQVPAYHRSWLVMKKH